MIENNLNGIVTQLTTDEKIKIAQLNIKAMINNRCNDAHAHFNCKIIDLKYKTEDSFLRVNKPVIYWTAKGLEKLIEILNDKPFKRKTLCN